MRLRSPRAESPSRWSYAHDTTKPGDTRKRGRRAVHLDRTYIGGRKREALSHARVRARGERMKFFRRSAPSGITTCKERSGPPPLPDLQSSSTILSASIRNPACSKSWSETARGCLRRMFREVFRVARDFSVVCATSAVR